MQWQQWQILPESLQAVRYQRQYSIKDLDPAVRTAFKLLLVSMAGLLWSEVAGSFYAPFFAATLILLAPGIFVFISLVIFLVLLLDRRQDERRARLLRNISVVAAAATILIAVFLNLNGALDKNPYEEVETQVVHKFTRTSMRRPNVYYAVVRPMSAQVANEVYVTVSSYKYDRLEAGDTIYVKVHPGWISLPWYEENLRNR